MSRARRARARLIVRARTRTRTRTEYRGDRKPTQKQLRAVVATQSRSRGDVRARLGHAPALEDANDTPRTRFERAEAVIASPSGSRTRARGRNRREFPPPPPPPLPLSARASDAREARWRPRRRSSRSCRGNTRFSVREGAAIARRHRHRRRRRPLPRSRLSAPPHHRRGLTDPSEPPRSICRGRSQGVLRDVAMDDEAE